MSAAALEQANETISQPASKKSSKKSSKKGKGDSKAASKEPSPAKVPVNEEVKNETKVEENKKPKSFNLLEKNSAFDLIPPIQQIYTLPELHKDYTELEDGSLPSEDMEMSGQVKYMQAALRFHEHLRVVEGIYNGFPVVDVPLSKGAVPHIELILAWYIRKAKTVEQIFDIITTLNKATRNCTNKVYGHPPLSCTYHSSMHLLDRVYLLTRGEEVKLPCPSRPWRSVIWHKVGCRSELIKIECQLASKLMDALLVDCAAFNDKYHQYNLKYICEGDYNCEAVLVNQAPNITNTEMLDKNNKLETETKTCEAQAVN